MRVAILDDEQAPSAYLAEIFRTWGLPLCDPIGPQALDTLVPAECPAVVCPAGIPERDHQALLSYAAGGGTVVSFLPREDLARAAGLEWIADKEPPLRLRLTGMVTSGHAGEQFPIVGSAATYRATDDAFALAYLSRPGRFDDESIAITETRVGSGRIVSFAFDLALCVLMLRQGDPAKTEFAPKGDTCARPSHLASDIGPDDSGWFPYADFLSRLLVDLVRDSLPAPVPLLHHLPGDAKGLLLYSGDEDGAEVAWNDEELDYVADAGGRMSLYLIPINTKSTRGDVERYKRRNDVGPHPNLRPLDGEPVSVRVAEFERQILMYQDLFGSQARTLRNHSTAWAGYTDLPEIMEKLGIGMEANFFSGNYMRSRTPEPYAAYGAALPMRFCRPNGRLIDVFQQHTHVSDDVLFHATVDYSYKISPEQYSAVLDRVLTDIVTRFHTPYAVCIHPSNWVRFSRPQGQELLLQASRKGLPVWSLDQWLDFWEARDGWRFENLTWDGERLELSAAGQSHHPDLALVLPAEHKGRRCAEIQLNGEIVPLREDRLYSRPVSPVPLSAAGASAAITAVYR